MHLSTIRCNSCHKNYKSSISLSCLSYVFICNTCGNGLPELLVREQTASENIQLRRLIKEFGNWGEVYNIIVNPAGEIQEDATQ